MDKEEVQTLALLAGNGAMLAFIVQNQLDDKIDDSDALRIGAFVLCTVIASFAALMCLHLKSPARRLSALLQGFASIGIVGPPALWLARLAGAF